MEVGKVKGQDAGQGISFSIQISMKRAMSLLQSFRAGRYTGTGLCY